jgi:hypothetical protein
MWICQYKLTIERAAGSEFPQRRADIRWGAHIAAECEILLPAAGKKTREGTTLFLSFVHAAPILLLLDLFKT